MMATPSNQALLIAANLMAAADDALSGGDLIIAVQAEDDAAATEALSAAQQALESARGPRPEGFGYAPQSIAGAVQADPAINLALIWLEIAASSSASPIDLSCEAVTAVTPVAAITPVTHPDSPGSTAKAAIAIIWRMIFAPTSTLINV